MDMKELEDAGAKIRQAPIDSPALRRRIEQRIPGGEWVTDAKGYLKALKEDYTVRAMLRTPSGGPVSYCTTKEWRNEQAVQALADMMTGDDLRRAGLRK